MADFLGHIKEKSKCKVGLLKKATKTNDDLALHPWRVNQVVECKRFDGAFLYQKVRWFQKWKS